MANRSSYQTIDISNYKAHPKQSRFKVLRGPPKSGLAGGGFQTCSCEEETLKPCLASEGGRSNLRWRE